MKLIYLDNAATTPVDKDVIKAMLPFLDEKFGNASSLHKYGMDAKQALDKSREIIACKINAKPEEIIFTSGGSESDNLALKGIAHEYSYKGKHIITSRIEHPAVLESCKDMEDEGFNITYLDVDKEGFVNLSQLKKAIRKDTILVSIMHANNEIGTIQDISSIGKMCREKGIIFHSDCVQSFSKVPIDVEKMCIGLASLSSHKIHGPKGIGALYVSNEIRLRRMIHGGKQEFGYRAGTENIPAIVGFAKAVELAEDKYVGKMGRIRDLIISRLLNEIPDSFLNGTQGDKRLCNNINISFRFTDGEALMMDLDVKGIAVSTGSACSSGSKEPSHVLMAIDLEDSLARGSIRITLNRYLLSENEIDYVVKSIKEIVTNIRKINTRK